MTLHLFTPEFYPMYSAEFGAEQEVVTRHRDKRERQNIEKAPRRNERKIKE